MQKKLVSIIITTMLLAIPVITFATSSSLYNKKNQIEQNITNAQREQNEVKNEIVQTKSEINKLNDEITEKEYEVDKIKEELDDLTAEVNQLSEDLKAAEEHYDDQFDKLGKRLAAQQKRGTASYLDVLLNSKNLTDFISRYHIMEKIAEIDSKILEDIKEEQKQISNTKAEVEKKKETVAEKHKQLETEEAILKNNKLKKDKYVSQLSAEEQALQNDIDKYNKELKQTEADILAYLSTINGNSNGPYKGGKILWPVGGSGGRISSYFGYRGSAATGGVGTANHNGYDIAAPHNTPIYASESGTVLKVIRACSHDYPKTYKTKCNCGGGYGNYLIIDHGGRLQTLYGHCASISVNVGQTVSKGQTIGTVGSAGWSTGYHLHFSVIYNNKYVDPGNYIGR